MMKIILSKLDLKTILILILIIIIVIMRACGGKQNITTTPGQTVNVDGSPHVVIKHVRDTQYIKKDTIIYKKGKDIYHDIPVYVEIPQNVDTVEILKDYFSSVTYKDTLKLNDSLGEIRITDVISKNKIQERTFSSTINKTLITDTLILKEAPKRQLYFGVNSSFIKEDIIGAVGTGFIYKDKKDKVYLMGVGAQQTQNSNLTPYIQGGLYWKIRLKK